LQRGVTAEDAGRVAEPGHAIGPFRGPLTLSAHIPFHGPKAGMPEYLLRASDAS
jgi:hypothetical protein